MTLAPNRLRSLLAATLPLATFAMLAGPAPARADGTPPTPPTSMTKNKVLVELAADVDAITPGETFRLGVFLRPEPDWHVYWKFAGDTGLPTEIDWVAPDGFDFGAVDWPVPHRIPDKLGGRAFGYEKEVLHATAVRVPEQLPEGSTVTFEAKVKWLACKENCVQGSAHVALSLAVKNAPAAERRSKHADGFDTWATKVPVKASDLRVTSTVTGAPVPPGGEFSVTLGVSDPTGKPLALERGDLKIAPLDAFYPATEGLEVPEVLTEVMPDGSLRLTLKGRAAATEALPGKLAGVVNLVRDGAPYAFDVTVEVPRQAGSTPPSVSTKATLAPAPSAATADGPKASLGTGDPCADAGHGTGTDDKLSSFALALLFAFLGGLILNAMPCVLPVLSLKILGLVEQSGDSPKVIWRHGLIYTAGVLASFLVFAIILVALQQGSWAFQFQDPTFVAIFTAIVFAFGLSLFGVFELSAPGAAHLDAAVAGSHGYMSSFNYGIFAVLLGTPCTAPFLGPALAYAFTRPPFEMTVLLLTVGLGMAFPFLVLARFPGWRKLMPKPGPWLLTFKKVMGFLLIGTAVFMLSIFAAQVSRAALISYIVFLAVLAFALFVYGHWTEPTRSGRTRFIAIVVSLALTVVGAWRFVSLEAPEAVAGSRVIDGVTWFDFDQTDVNKKAQDGHLVFIDFTADWCTTCKVNEATAIHTDATKALFERLGVTPVKGDFTVHKPEIAKWLQRFEEPSVPLYVVIPAGRPNEAFKLPTLLSEGDVREGICRAHRLVTSASL